MPKLYKVFSRILFTSFIISFFTVNVFGLGTLLPTQNIPTLEQTQTEEISPIEDSGNSLMQFTSEGHVLGFDKDSVYIASGSHALKVEFVDGNNVKPLAERTSNAQNDQLIQAKALPLDKVTYKGIWENIDLTYTATKNGIAESTYFLNNSLQKNANVEDIKLRYNTPVSIDNQGNLVTNYETGTLTESAPIAWQMIDGIRKTVEVSYVQYSDFEIGFKLGAFVNGFPVTIDPVITWNTFLGNNVVGSNYAFTITTDSSGNIYISGWSQGTWGNPIRDYTASTDVFVAKLSSTGTLIWNTFLGGTASDSSATIKVDSSGYIYVVGNSWAIWGTPILEGDGGIRAFLAKLNNSGTLLWNTFFGGSWSYFNDLVFDSTNSNVYVCGYSLWGWGSPLNPFNIKNDIILAKYTTSGTLSWHTYTGGTGEDYGYGIARDSSNNIYIVGKSDVSWGTTIKKAYTLLTDIFVVKLNSAGTYQWNTFLGGSGDDSGYRIVLDSSNYIYISGDSNASWGTTIKRSYSGGVDSVITKLNSSGTYQWNMFLGSSVDDPSNKSALVIDSSNYLYTAGTSKGSWGSPLIEYTASTSDAFAVKISNTGVLEWNTFIGGTGIDDGRGITLDSSKNIFVTGSSNVTWGDPVNSFPGRTSIFVAKLPYTFVDPTFTSITGSSTTWYNTARTAVINASDSSGSGLSELRYNWGVNAMNTTCTSGGIIISNGQVTEGSPAGDKTLYLCARNNAGNYFSTSQANYRWEDTPPSTPNSMTTIEDNNGDIIGEFPADIPSGSTDTGGSGFESYSLWKCDDDLLTLNCVVIASGINGTTVNVSAPYLPAEDNTMYYYWTSIDNAGNTSANSTYKALTMNAILPPPLTDTPTPTPISGGTTVQGVAPEIQPVLVTDWNTNLETTAQTGNVVVGVEDTVNANIKVAELDVNFNTSPDWTGVTGATDENIAFFHSPEPISTITNGAASSYSLYIRKGEGDKVWICPGAASLSEVNLQCSGGYFISEGQTVNGATATVITNGVEYWKVSGLTSTGGMSVITGLKDVLSRLQVSTLSDHKLSFGTSYGMIVGSTDTMTLEFPDFDLTGLTVTDIALTDNVGSLRTLAGTASADTWGVAINTVAKSIIFSVPTSGTGGYLPASQIIVKIGLNVVGGVNQITNPTSIGNTTISITLNNTDPGEMGILNIPIIDSDTVDISGYVTAFIHFDIDTNTDNTDCAFDVCKTHGAIGAGTGDNYTVDFGELTSAIVNKSQASSVHSDGLTGIINSIYFDLTTNAPSGAVVTVKSLNSGLKGPGTNLISSVTDGLDIAANSGLYGYNLTTASTQKYGAIYPNSLCDTIIKFCGPTSTPKTVFDTNNLPVDSARVRMDLAAAAAYTNNPGLYEDTLTFIATATF
jgi:hypothetical protein